MTVLKQQEKCRICSGTNFEHFLDLGFSPPADQFFESRAFKGTGNFISSNGTNLYRV